MHRVVRRSLCQSTRAVCARDVFFRGEGMGVIEGCIGCKQSVLVEDGVYEVALDMHWRRVVRKSRYLNTRFY